MTGWIVAGALYVLGGMMAMTIALQDRYRGYPLWKELIAAACGAAAWPLFVIIGFPVDVRNWLRK